MRENDEVAFSYAQSNIEHIIQKNKIAVTSSQWDNMNVDQKFLLFV